MKMFKMGVGVLAAVLLTAVSAKADDVASLKAELSDLKAKVASMESTQAAPAACGDCESLTSMKKKAAIKIGGEARVFTAVVRRDDNPTALNGENDRINITDFNADGYLYIDAEASQDAKLRIKLDLDDFFDGAVQNTDLLEEVYFQFKNVMCMPLTVNFGKKEIEAFGLDRYIGKDAGLYHGVAPVLNYNDGASVPASAANTIGTVGTNSFVSAEYDNAFAAEAIYSFQDLAKVYLGVFQNANTGMHEDRSEDSLFFESYAAKLELTPIEGVKMQTSFINRHVDSRGDSDIYGKAEADTKALSTSIQYDPKCLPISMWVEYIHAWDAGYRSDAENDFLNVGAEYKLSDCWKLGGMFNWASIDNSTTSAYADEDYYDLSGVITYTMSNGIELFLQYSHEWYEGDLRAGGNLDADADMLLFCTRFTF